MRKRNLNVLEYVQIAKMIYMKNSGEISKGRVKVLKHRPFMS
ncbi:hypothetical protein MHB48_07085 [Psychrobacillus sp. FSL H8-0483]